MQVEVALKDIVADPEINFRTGLDQETVDRYKESERLLPPMTVFRVDGQLLLADGFHRYEALKQAGVERVVVDQSPGTRETAKGRAALANIAHGKQLTRPERNRAITWLYDYGLPTEDIARHFALSESMVSRIATEAGTRRRDPDIAQKGVATRRARRSPGAAPAPALAEAPAPAPATDAPTTPVLAPVATAEAVSSGPRTAEQARGDNSHELVSAPSAAEEEPVSEASVPAAPELTESNRDLSYQPQSYPQPLVISLLGDQWNAVVDYLVVGLRWSPKGERAELVRIALSNIRTQLRGLGAPGPVEEPGPALV